jgi:hypothetical protein
VTLNDNGRSTQAQIEGVTVSAVGDHIIIAYDDSIVFVGDDGELTANTGDASSSGTVALDVSGSELTSGDSSVSPGAAATQRSAAAALGPGVTVGSTHGPIDLSPAPGRAMVFSGFEDHSVHVAGSDNLATYDDSNVFVARNGQINSNTGDTDSSGLNVVDAKRSVVRTGDHDEGDGNGDDEEPEEPEEEEDTATPAAQASGSGSTSTAAAPSASPSAPAPQSAPSQPAAPPAPPAGRATGSVADEGDSTASGDQALVIGADGYDDLSLNVAGQRNTATYDDSNVVVGGTGGVNAQIGDSDTSGAVVMGVEDSVVESGPST